MKWKVIFCIFILAIFAFFANMRYQHQYFYGKACRQFAYMMDLQFTARPKAISNLSLKELSEISYQSVGDVVNDGGFIYPKSMNDINWIVDDSESIDELKVTIAIMMNVFDGDFPLTRWERINYTFDRFDQVEKFDCKVEDEKTLLGALIFTEPFIDVFPSSSDKIISLVRGEQKNFFYMIVERKDGPYFLDFRIKSNGKIYMSFSNFKDKNELDAKLSKLLTIANLNITQQ